MTEQVLISAMLAIPFAAWLLGLALPARQSTATVFSTSLVSVIAVAWIGFSSVGMIKPSAMLSAGEWLSISPASRLSVNLTFHAGPSRNILALAASLILLLKTVRTTRSEAAHQSKIALLYPLSLTAILAENLIVLSSIWFMIDCYVLSLLSGARDSLNTTQKRVNTVPMLSCSGVLLLIAALMGMSRFSSSDLGQIIAHATEDGRVDSVTVVSGLSVLFVTAIAVRCAFFPALIWPRTFVDNKPGDSSLIIILAGVLPGASLAGAIFPLCGISEDAVLLLGMLGVLTCLTATSIAFVQNDTARIVSLLSISAAGLAVSALATCQPSSVQIASYTIFVQLAAIFVLQRNEISPRRGIGVGIAMALSLSGIGGSNAILSLIESQLRNIANVSSDGPTEYPLLLIWWGIVISQVLWGIAVVKLATVQPSVPYSQSKKSEPVRAAEFVALTVAALALALCFVPASSSQPVNTKVSNQLFTFGAATPACLIGAISAWLLTRSSDHARARVASRLNSLTRLSREWFYLEDAVRYGIILPARGLSIVAEFCDRKLLGGTTESGWKKLPTQLAGMIEFLRTQPAVYYGLTGILLVVGLLWSLR